MSSITISPWVADARPTRVVVRPSRGRRAGATEATGALRLTRRGRVVVMSFFLAAIAVLMIAFGGLATGTFDRGAPAPVRIVEVHPGDTLYGIAGTVAKPGQVSDMVEQIQQLNSLSTPVLQVGQKIAIPVAAK